MALKTMIKQITAAKKKYDAAMKKAGKSAKKEIAAALSEHLPEGFVLEWNQYTPYFNDGEECVFSVNDAYVGTFAPLRERDKYDPNDAADECPEGHDPKVAIEAGSEVDPDGDERTLDSLACEEDDGVANLFYSDVDALEKYGLDAKTFKKIKAAWKAMPEDLLRQAFGDHATIRVYADGELNTDTCEHE